MPNDKKGHEGSLSFPRRELPEILFPTGTRCIQIDIPDDDDWERDAYAAVYEGLATWLVWQLDEGKNAVKVAALWRKALATWRHCDGSKSPIHGQEVEEMSLLRVDCECRVWVTCCDGTEKELVTADMIGNPSQPGPGQPQPKPGGPAQCYHATLAARDKYYVPTVVNTGDVITISNGQGAVSNSYNGAWHCFDGEVFFAGACVGTPLSNDDAPVTSAPVSTLVAKIGTTFYSLLSGTLTVPDGVSSQEVTVQVNDSALTDLAGEFTFDLCVKSNKALTFSHTWDFTLSPGPFILRPGYVSGQVWTPGAGWVGGDIPAQYGSGETWGLIVDYAGFPSVTINTAAVLFDRTGESGGAHQWLNIDNQSATLGSIDFPTENPTGTNLSRSFTVNLPCTELQVVLYASVDNPTPPGAVTLKSLTVTGLGADPF
jgi:hypothetical protein